MTEGTESSAGWADVLAAMTEDQYLDFLAALGGNIPDTEEPS